MVAIHRIPWIWDLYGSISSEPTSCKLINLPKVEILNTVLLAKFRKQCLVLYKNYCAAKVN